MVAEFLAPAGATLNAGVGAGGRLGTLLAAIGQVRGVAGSRCHVFKPPAVRCMRRGATLRSPRPCKHYHLLPTIVVGLHSAAQRRSAAPPPPPFAPSSPAPRQPRHAVPPHAASGQQQPDHRWRPGGWAAPAACGRPAGVGAGGGPHGRPPHPLLPVHPQPHGAAGAGAARRRAVWRGRAVGRPCQDHHRAARPGAWRPLPRARQQRGAHCCACATPDSC